MKSFVKIGATVYYIDDHHMEVRSGIINAIAGTEVLFNGGDYAYIYRLHLDEVSALVALQIQIEKQLAQYTNALDKISTCYKSYYK